MSLPGRRLRDRDRFHGCYSRHSGRRQAGARRQFRACTAVLASMLTICGAVVSNPARANDFPANIPNSGTADPINSQHFEFEGSCRGSGKDMVYTWNGGEGKIPPPDQIGKSFIYPWLENDILIRGLELAVVKPWASFVDWLAVGNNTWGDFMLLLGNGESHGANFYPGTAFRFPAKRKTTPLTYIDLHGSCWHPFKARIFLELYYTLAGSAP